MGAKLRRRGRLQNSDVRSAWTKLQGGPALDEKDDVSQRDSLLQFALKVTSGPTVPQHMFERLVHGMRGSLDVLPDPLSRALESHIRRMVFDLATGRCGR